MELEYGAQLKKILSYGYTYVSDVSPSDWTERHMVMKKPFPGPYKYSRTPYAKDIINCLSQNSPYHTIVLMKGAQIGMSAGVIIPGIGWIIKNNPGNIYLSVGSPDLVKKAMNKLDYMIDSTGIRSLIRPQANRAKNQQTGDTNEEKQFAGGVFAIGSANNHKNLRQEDIQYVFLDDLEAIKKASKESGDTLSLVKTRQLSYHGKKKLFLISTPELKETSNIEPAYLLGDQRKFFVPCPCCGVFIELKWAHEHPVKKVMCGITWQVDDKYKLIPESVGYRCQECFEFFTDKHKTEMLSRGYWEATAESSEPGYISFHISSLYAPIGMADWIYWVREYLVAVPANGKDKDEEKYKTFVNVCLGETYEMESEKLSSNKIQNNTRSYQIEVVPEKQSIEDGNGRVVLLTCACDLNGTLEDARLDFEVLAHSETGSTYSITHGSIGTFIPNQTKEQKEKTDRLKWTYQHGKPNSVWPVFYEVINKLYEVDTGRNMGIYATAVDTGYCEKEAYEFIDGACDKGLPVFGVKGDKETKYLPLQHDSKTYKEGVSRPNLYLVLGSKLKDQLSKQMKLKWEPHKDEKQPVGFCNFPEPSGGLYTYKNFFSHYESEHRKIDRKGSDIVARWEKVSPTSQNHLWDCRVYNMAVREIFINELFKEYKIKNGMWADFVSMVLAKQ